MVVGISTLARYFPISYNSKKHVLSIIHVSEIENCQQKNQSHAAQKIQLSSASNFILVTTYDNTFISKLEFPHVNKKGKQACT